MYLAEDLTLFTADFGEAFTHPTYGSFDAIFKDKHASYDNEYGISSYAPIISLPASITVTFAVGDVITRVATGVSYTVSDFQPDGTGFISIRLYEV